MVDHRVEHGGTGVGGVLPGPAVMGFRPARLAELAGRKREWNGRSLRWISGWTVHDPGHPAVVWAVTAGAPPSRVWSISWSGPRRPVAVGWLV